MALPTKPVTTADIFAASWNVGKISRFSPDARGVYSRIWVSDGIGNPIGMVDDGKFVYLATWSKSTIIRYNMVTGVRDTSWQILIAGGNGGDLESLTIRRVAGRDRIVAGFADGRPQIWEYDLLTRAFIKSYVFKNARRGADWIWSLPNGEFLVGTESDKYWRVNIDTGVETPYITGVGVSYSIEMRNGVIAAANASNGDSLTIGKCNPKDASNYVQTKVFTGLPVGIYFSTSIEFDGKHAWVASYDATRGADRLGNPIYRINTETGAGSEKPIAHLSEGWDIQGIYAPYRDGRFNNLKGYPDWGDVHMDATADPAFRMLS